MYWQVVEKRFAAAQAGQAAIERQAIGHQDGRHYPRSGDGLPVPEDPGMNGFPQTTAMPIPPMAAAVTSGACTSVK
jgi:hypothetical protein